MGRGGSRWRGGAYAVLEPRLRRGTPQTDGGRVRPTRQVAIFGALPRIPHPGRAHRLLMAHIPTPFFRGGASAPFLNKKGTCFVPQQHQTAKLQPVPPVFQPHAASNPVV